MTVSAQAPGKLHDLIERLQQLHAEHGDLDVYVGFPNVPNEGRMDAPLTEVELEHYDPIDPADRAVMLWGQDPAAAIAESITVDEFIRREAPNWAGVDAVEFVRTQRGDAPPFVSTVVAVASDLRDMALYHSEEGDPRVADALEPLAARLMRLARAERGGVQP